MLRETLGTAQQRNGIQKKKKKKKKLGAEDTGQEQWLHSKQWLWKTVNGTGDMVVVPLNWEGGKSCWTSSHMVPGPTLETPTEQY